MPIRLTKVQGATENTEDTEVETRGNAVFFSVLSVLSVAHFVRRFKINSLTLLCAVCGLLCLASPASALTTAFEIPLRDGRLHTQDLADNLLKHLRLPSDCLSAELDLRGLRGSLLVAAWNKALGEGCSVAIADDALVVRIDTEKLPDEIDEAKLAARTFTEVAAPEATANQRASFGLLLPRQLDESLALTILVHGLDCNRANWAPLADYLEHNGHQVAYFTYPSDQPLADSASLLSDHVATLREAYPNLPLNIVTHSMGALVARDFLEGPAYSGGVQRFIMIAPPNHGSKWASLRWALEVQEHYYLWRDDSTWSPTWAITDGLGEAGRDLKSKSRYLKQLNARSRREGVRYTIIAGDRHPAVRMAGDAVSNSARLIPRNARKWWGFRQTYNGLRDAGEELRESSAKSDGPVSVKSARLDGVDDFVLVHGDHTTTYIPADGDTEPPAWAVVNERLAR